MFLVDALCDMCYKVNINCIIINEISNLSYTCFFIHFMLLFTEGCVIVVSRINVIMIYKKKMCLKLCCKTLRCFRNHKMIPLKYHLMKTWFRNRKLKLSISIHLFPIKCLSQDSKENYEIDWKLNFLTIFFSFH